MKVFHWFCRYQSVEILQPLHSEMRKGHCKSQPKHQKDVSSLAPICPTSGNSQSGALHILNFLRSVTNSNLSLVLLSQPSGCRMRAQWKKKSIVISITAIKSFLIGDRAVMESGDSSLCYNSLFSVSLSDRVRAIKLLERKPPLRYLK